MDRTAAHRTANGAFGCRGVRQAQAYAGTRFRGVLTVSNTVLSRPRTDLGSLREVGALPPSSATMISSMSHGMVDKKSMMKNPLT